MFSLICGAHRTLNDLVTYHFKLFSYYLQVYLAIEFQERCCVCISLTSVRVHANFPVIELVLSAVKSSRDSSSLGWSFRCELYDLKSWDCQVFLATQQVHSVSASHLSSFDCCWLHWHHGFSNQCWLHLRCLLIVDFSSYYLEMKICERCNRYWEELKVVNKSWNLLFGSYSLLSTEYWNLCFLSFAFCLLFAPIKLVEF